MRDSLDERLPGEVEVVTGGHGVIGQVFQHQVEAEVGFRQIGGQAFRRGLLQTGQDIAGRLRILFCQAEIALVEEQP